MKAINLYASYPLEMKMVVFEGDTPVEKVIKRNIDYSTITGSVNILENKFICLDLNLN